MKKIKFCTLLGCSSYNNNIFSEHIGAIRIYVLFAFRWKYLKHFSSHPETKLEKLESCDSNRVLDMDFDQYVSKFPYVESFSVDSPKDINRVEKSIINDKYWGAYYEKVANITFSKNKKLREILNYHFTDVI